jgi:DNA (cytosine-5)-methyltransferase 1
MQVGNAVPVILGRVAGNAIAHLLEHPCKEITSPVSGEAQKTITHLRPHVRTRWWWKNGKVIDGVPYHCRPTEERSEDEGMTLFNLQH